MEKPPIYDKPALFRAGKSLQDARVTIHEGGISLSGGGKSKSLREKQNSATNFAVEMHSIHNAWVDTKFQPLFPYLQKKGKHSVDEVTESLQVHYKEGLRTVITLFSRASNDTFDA